MENTNKRIPNSSILKSERLQQYILETSVYPRESKHLKDLRDATATHPWFSFFFFSVSIISLYCVANKQRVSGEFGVLSRSFIAVSPDSAQLMGLLLKLLKPKKTIEIGVFTGYSLLQTALSIPDDAKITAIDPDRKAYEIGFPFIENAGVAHKINFIEAPALPVLDQLLQDKANEGSFEFAFVDADKKNYWNYHERLLKLIKVGGMVIYDNTLWGGTVALPEDEVPEAKLAVRNTTVEFNKKIAADQRVEIAVSASGDGFTICRRL